MAGVAATPPVVAGPPVVVNPVVAKPAVAKPAVAGPVKNELNTLKVGVFGSLKKGENWQPVSSLPPNEPPFKLGNIHAAKNRPPGKEVYANLDYTNYDVDAVPSDFKDASGNPIKDASGNPIVTIDQVSAPKKQGRFYGKTQNDPAKTHATFQTALHTFRKTQFTAKLAKKKADNKAALNALQKQITTGTQSELDEMTKVYTATKTILQAKLEDTFKQHKQKVLDNKVADKKYDKAPHDLLANDLQKAGDEVIKTLAKPRETRRRHRFMHLLVKPGDAVVPAPDPVDRRTPENIAWDKLQANLAASEEAVRRARPGAGAGAAGPGAGDRSPGPPGPPPPPPPPPPPARPLVGGSRKRKTKRKPRRSSK